MNKRRTLAVIIFLLLSAMAAKAQSYIFGRADFPVGAGAISIAVGDFNGDGTSDLAIVNEGDNTVSILLGKSDGTFVSQVTYATGLGPLAIVTGDFNGDGNLDLAVTNGDCINYKFGLSCDVRTVSILLGNGDGTFQPHFDYATGTQPSSVASGDFNADGKLDLVITNAQDSTVSVLLGNGDGTFQTQVVYPTGPYLGPQSVIVADFNGDHKLDLAVGGNGVSVLLGNGDGTFQNHLDFQGGFQGGSPLAAADFNRDGKLDLYAGGDILLGNGDGTFVLNATYPRGTFAATADLNGDGKPDLVVTDAGYSNDAAFSVAVLIGNGDGTFQLATQYAAGIGPSSLVIADFNGDGKFDLAVPGGGCGGGLPCLVPGEVSILLGFGDGTFAGGKDYFPREGAPAFPISADFNGDGKPDIAFTTTNALGVFPGNGDGTFQGEVSTSLGQLSPGPIAAGDFNRDGKIDLATTFSTCCSPGNAGILLGNGDGTFQSPIDYVVGLNPGNLAVADFNGDGYPDLAVSNYGANTVSILLSKGDGTFQPHVDYTTGAYPGTMITGDFNGDGKLDIVIQSSPVSLLLGNGDGTFRTTEYPIQADAQPITVGDFNGDGRLDLAVPTQLSHEVLVFFGNGDGTFQSAIASPDGLDFGSASVGDFNGDGKQDLIVSGAFSYISEMLIGNGDGTFQKPVLDFLASGPIVVADFNQDGSPDVAGGHYYINNGPSAVSVMLSAAFKAVSPGSLNFGSQGVGTTSAAQTITLSNPSNLSFNIASIAASGNFSQTNNCGAHLVPGAHCAVTVNFTPTATGLESGAITVIDNTKISPLAVPLNGTGVNGSFLTPYPSRVNFAPQAVGTSSTPAVVMLVNTGNASLNISGISITGADSSDFTQINNCGSSLPAAGSCNVNVTFTPTAAGSRTAGVAVSDTAPGSPQSVSLAGTGLGPIANLSPNTLTFAAQALGTTSIAQVVTLTNIGGEPLNLTQISASGDFGETNTCNTSLASANSCQISVTFTPTATGTRTGSITIADNAAGSPQQVPLSGVGTSGNGQEIGLSIPSGGSNSQTVQAGAMATYTLSIGGNGWSGQVSLSCTGAPTGASCSFPGGATMNVSGSSAKQFNVAVSTMARTRSALIPSGHVPAPWLWAMLAVGLVVLPGSVKAKHPGLQRTGMLTLLLLLLCSCGGGGSSSSSNGTPAGSYPLTVTASAGSINQSVPLTLTVQ